MRGGNVVRQDYACLNVPDEALGYEGSLHSFRWRLSIEVYFITSIRFVVALQILLVWGVMIRYGGS